MLLLLATALGFTPPPDAQRPLGNGPLQASTVVDLDLDGHDDIVWVDQDELYAWRGPIPGPYLVTTYPTIRRTLQGIVRADVDADGVSEVVFQVNEPGGH